METISDMFEDDSAKEGKEDEGANEDKKKSQDSDDSSDMFGSGDEKAEGDKAKKEEEGDDEKKADSDDDDKAEDEKKEEEEPPKRIRPMSLAAVPTFHEQDMARVRMLHGDLLTSSILEHAKTRLATVTRDYNNGKNYNLQYTASRSMKSNASRYLFSLQHTESPTNSLITEPGFNRTFPFSLPRLAKILPSPTMIMPCK